MLFDVSELNNIFLQSQNKNSFLEEIVKLIKKHIKADVCSIYLHDENSNEIVLRATEGLKKDAIGKVRLKPGEGVAGAAFENMKTICETDAEKLEFFKHIPGINEERYKAYLAAPINRGSLKIGVIILQRKTAIGFTDEDILALKSTSSQLAATLDTAKFLLISNTAANLTNQVSNEIKDGIENKLLKGESASKGFAFGKASVFKKKDEKEFDAKYKFNKFYFLNNFEEALVKTEQQLKEMQKLVDDRIDFSAALIFSAHILMLKDETFNGKIRILIKKGVNPPNAVLQIGNEYITRFLSNSHQIVKEKASDMKDLIQRIIFNLLNKENDGLNISGKILIAEEIMPSDIIKFWSEKVKGIILISGGVMSHLSILARSISMPLIIINEPALLKITSENKILMDADTGAVYINPDAHTIELFSQRENSLNILAEKKEIIQPQTFTRDGIRIELFSNINLISEAQIAIEFKSDGIGLYRSEFPFLIRNNFPSEEEQFYIYRKLFEFNPDKPVTIRTLDVGGDKLLSYFQSANKEQNPFLGLRSIRFSLENIKIFSEQIRAILRAGADHKQVNIMFPMISSVDELYSCREIVNENIIKLKTKNIPIVENPRIGIMLEVPSVIEILPDLAKLSDFFSIGTNDFTQYLLAVDRTNENVSHLYKNHHPAVLRSLKRIADVSIANNIPLSICGEMANNDKYIPFLIGIGLRKLSIEPRRLPDIQKFINSLTISEAEKISLKLLSLSKISEIENEMLKFE